MTDNFVDDDLTFSNQPKTDLIPIGAADPLKHIQASDWMEVLQACYDLRAALAGLVGGAGAGFYGSGVDGSHTLDGTTTVLGMVPSGNVYTMPRNLYFTDLVINTSVSLKAAGFIPHINGTLSGAGNIERNGNAGSGATQGAALTSKILPGAAAGASGGANGYGAPGTAGNSASAPFNFPTAGGGAGGHSGFGAPGDGGGGTAGTVTAQAAQFGDIDNFETACAAYFNGYQGGSLGSTSFTCGSGGGGGRGGQNNGGASTGGGGGGSGGWLVVKAKHITLTGVISADGGAGGNGGSAADGGGGGGGQGGVAVLVYSSGTPPTVRASGGAGGTGGPVSDTSGAHGTGQTGFAGADGLAKVFQV